MLRLMLDSHPELAIPGESHFIPALWEARRRYRRSGAGFDAELLARDICSTPHVRRWEIDVERVLARVRSLPAPTFAGVVGCVFEEYAALHGKRRWGDKTPIYVLSIDLLARLFPQARFVHVVRDGRDVALSYLSVPWGPATIWQVARKWRREVNAGLAAAERHGVFEVRYERLVEDPEAVVREVCDFADLAFDPRMLRREDAGERIQSRPERERFHTHAAEPVTAGLRDWRSQMSERDVRAFEAVAGDLLVRLGYGRRFPDVGRRARLQAALRVGALDLRAAASDARKALVRRVTGRPPAKVGSE